MKISEKQGTTIILSLGLTMDFLIVWFIFYL